MIKCFDHKTAFLEKHRDFRPAIGISKNFPIVGGNVELQKSNVQKHKTWIRSLWMIFLKCSIVNKIISGDPNSKGYQIHNPELRLHPICASDRPVCLYIRYKKDVYIYIYIYISYFISFPPLTRDGSSILTFPYETSNQYTCLNVY